MKTTELRAAARNAKIKGWWKMSKHDLQTQVSLFNNFGRCTCPSCGTNLDNGVSDYESQLEVAKSTGEKAARISREFVCLACGEEFGDLVATAKEGNITLAEVCKLVDIKPTAARRQLRKIWGARNETYVFTPGQVAKVQAAKNFTCLA